MTKNSKNLSIVLPNTCLPDLNGLVNQATTPISDISDNETLKWETHAIYEKMLDNNKCYREALTRRKVQLILKHRMDDILLTGVHDSELCRFSEWIKNGKESEPVYFITLSLPTPINYHDLISNWNTYIQTRKWLLKGTKWVWEQRGKDKDTYLQGLHIHIIMPKTKKPPSEIIRDISDQTGLAKNYVDVRKRPKDQCEKYLVDKKPTYKKERQVYDNKMRVQFNLQNIYVK